MNIELLHDYPAIIHCHSTYSDGAKSIPEIASIAESVGIRFLMMTDHNNLRALEDGHGKWHGNVLVDIGYEINDKDDKNHFLAFALKNEVNRIQRPRDYVREVMDSGGFGFIAHPFEQRVRMPDYSIYPWTDWDVDGAYGLEIWNHMSAWMEGLSFLNRVMRVIHPRQSVWGPKDKALELWDEIAAKRRVVGIGGADAHGHKHTVFGNFKITIFRYKIIFKCLRTYILSEDPVTQDMPYDDARRILHTSLRNGAAFFAQYYLGDPSGFRFWAEKKDRKFSMGLELDFEKNIHIRAFIPQNKIYWRILRNGHEVITGKENKVHLEVPEAGAYRMEVYRKGRPWIYSNHLYIRLVV